MTECVQTCPNVTECDRAPRLWCAGRQVHLRGVPGLQAAGLDPLEAGHARPAYHSQPRRGDAERPARPEESGGGFRFGPLRRGGGRGVLARRVELGRAPPSAAPRERAVGAHDRDTAVQRRAAAHGCRAASGAAGGPRVLLQELHYTAGDGHYSQSPLVHHENIPARLASDWSIVRIYPCFLRLTGPSDRSVVRIYPRFLRLTGPSAWSVAGDGARAAPRDRARRHE
eukprot:4594536-Pyramimonas_sp.AAC.1